MDMEIVDVPICPCGVSAVLRHSFTKSNPGRRFYGCRKYGNNRDACNFFQWLDPPLPDHIQHVILKLLGRIKEEEERRKLMRRRVYQFLCLIAVFCFAFACRGLFCPVCPK